MGGVDKPAIAVGGRAMLTVALDASPSADPGEYLSVYLKGVFSTRPRRVTVAGRSGLLVAQYAEIPGTRAGPPRVFTRTVAAAPLDGRTMLRIELERLGAPDPSADAALVGQIAAAVEVDESAVRR